MTEEQVSRTKWSLDAWMKLRHHGVMTTTSHISTLPLAAFPTRETTLWAAVRDVVRSRRADRAYIHRVERELASYTSPSDRAELDAMIERSDLGAETSYASMIERIRLRAA